MSGTLPPLSPVPEPRVTIGMRAAPASRTHSATCAVDLGKHHRLGPLLQRRGAVEAVGHEVLGLHED